jgi:tetratricopeptide (TPR) repeat protein
MLSKLLINITVLTMLISCASTKSAKDQSYMTADPDKLTQKEVQDLNKKALEQVSNQLAELVEIAKKSSPEKQRFLANDMYLKASAAMMEGDYFTANIILEQLIKLDKDDAFLKRKYAISLIRTGDLEKSKIVLEKLFQDSKKKDEDIGLVLAGVYSSLGKAKEAIVVYKGILKRSPKSEEACLFLGKLYSIENKFNTAVKTLKRCEKRHKNNGVFSYNIGKFYIDKENLAKAERYFAKALKIQPDYAQAAMALGIVLEEKGKYKTAIKVYKKFLQKHPNNILILNRIVQSMFVTEQNKEVIPFALRLSDLESDNLNLKVKLGILYTENKDYEKALSIFRDILVQAPQSDKILYYIGAIYQEMNEYEKSVEYFAKVPDSSALYPDSSIQIANMLSSLAKNEYFASGKMTERHMDFVRYTRDKLYDLPTLKVEISVILANYYETVSLKEEALEALEEVADEQSFSDSHKYYLAALYELNGEFSQAVNLMTELVERDPKNAHAWNFIGYSMLERGEDLDKAYEYISKAVELSPEDGYILDSLGWYYYKKGKTNLALKKLLSAHKLVPEETSIHRHIAEVYLGMRKLDRAKKYLQTAMEHTKSNEDKQKLRQAIEELNQGRVPASF